MQYIGASVVIAGIIVTLIPTFFGHPTGGDDADATTQIIWSGVQVKTTYKSLTSTLARTLACGYLVFGMSTTNRVTPCRRSAVC